VEEELTLANPSFKFLLTYTGLTGLTREQFGERSVIDHPPTHRPASLQTHAHADSISTPLIIFYETAHCRRKSVPPCFIPPLAIS